MSIWQTVFGIVVASALALAVVSGASAEGNEHETKVTLEDAPCAPMIGLQSGSPEDFGTWVFDPSGGESSGAWVPSGDGDNAILLEVFHAIDSVNGNERAHSCVVELTVTSLTPDDEGMEGHYINVFLKNFNLESGPQFSAESSGTQPGTTNQFEIPGNGNGVSFSASIPVTQPRDLPAGTYTGTITVSTSEASG